MRTPLIPLPARLCLLLVAISFALPVSISSAAGGEAEEDRYTELQRFIRIWYAVFKNDPAEAKKVLDGGFDVNAKSPHGGYIQPGLTALHFAVENDAVEAAEVLLDQGADVEARDHQGRTALHYVAKRLLHEPVPELRQRITRFLELLLAHKADLNAEDDAGWTPLHHAALHYAALHYADSRQTVDLLVAKGGRHDIFIAAATGNVERLTTLLAMTPELARRALKGGSTPLHVAARTGNPEIAKLLLDAGANLQARDEEGQTPLHRASLGFRTRHSEVVELLLARTRVVDVRDNRGRTPLHYASHYWASQTSIPEQLLAQGAAVNARDDQGLTPLHFAVYQAGRKEICEFLLSHGADLDAETVSGVTPVELVRMHPERTELNAWLDELLAKRGAK
jgi:cytohesin